jgi:hypothetical protein
MEEWAVLTEYNWAFWIAGTFALAEFFKWLFTFKDWFFKTLGIETKAMREKKEWDDRLRKAESAIEEIKDTSKNNVDMFLRHEERVVSQFVGIRNEIVVELNKLHDKMDEQRGEMERCEIEGKKRDRAVLRDRISGGMRYFSSNADEDGNVHISVSDHENMESLFKEYFGAGGNGTFKQMYDNEFKKFIIDKQ